MVLQDIPFQLGRAYLNAVAHGFDEATINRIAGALRARDLRTLTSLWKPESSALHTTQFYTLHLRQIEAFFKKFDQFADEAVCDVAAILAFHEGERRCRVTNRRLTHYYTYPDRLSPLLGTLVEYVRRVIRRTLGSVESFLNEIPSNIRVSGGATITNSRAESHPLLKLGEHFPQCTPSFTPFYDALRQIGGAETWPLRPITVFHNRVEFVPKNWKTKRAIACESPVMMAVQLAFDTFCKRKLLHLGVTLGNQRRNQEAARFGSSFGHLATLDLKGASDSVALNLVHYLFPKDWAELLMRMRMPFGKLPSGTLVHYEKFASMGNGCTFPIESLVFAACCSAVNHYLGSRYLRVYGDDIIVPTESAELLTRLLRFLGFVPNREKSFTAGPFRESCGGDYWLGEDVTPFYLRSLTRRTDVALLLNAMRTFPVHPDLDRIAAELLRERHIPCVPPSDDLSAGLQVSVPECYRLGVLRGHGVRKANSPLTYRALTIVESPIKEDGGRMHKIQRLIDFHAKGYAGLLSWYINSLRGESIDPDSITPLLEWVMRLVPMEQVEQRVTTGRASVKLRKKQYWPSRSRDSIMAAYLGDLLFARISQR